MRDRPRIGFLGLGWIGLHRLKELVSVGVVHIAALADPAPQALARALVEAPQAAAMSELEELLACDLDGMVIATPSAAHADQAIRALEAGIAVFCQKPLAASGEEAAAVIDTARRMDRLLDVDMCYRRTRGMEALKHLMDTGELGDVYALDLMFHNAYGPDKPWYYDRCRAGGGCVIDLGIHLVDLAVWLLEREDFSVGCSHLFANGQRWSADSGMVEDYARVVLERENGSSVSIACSWNVPAGCDAVIEAHLLGTEGGARFRNVNGSFHDFMAERLNGTRSERLVEPPDAWGGRTLVSWASRLSQSHRFDPAIDQQGRVLGLIDDIYERARETSQSPSLFST